MSSELGPNAWQAMRSSFRQGCGPGKVKGSEEEQEEAGQQRGGAHGENDDDTRDGYGDGGCWSSSSTVLVVLVLVLVVVVGTRNHVVAVGGSAHEHCYGYANMVVNMVVVGVMKMKSPLTLKSNFGSSRARAGHTRSACAECSGFCWGDSLMMLL